VQPALLRETDSDSQKSRITSDNFDNADLTTQKADVRSGPAVTAFPQFSMPKSVPAPRRFLELCARPDARWLKVKIVSADTTKFKLRTSKYLYTIVLKEKFIKLVTDSLPPSLEVIHLDKEKK